MITSIKDENQFIVAYIEWRQVGKSGFDKFKGEYIYIADLWIHPEYRGIGLLEELIGRVLLLAPESQFGYFQRKKYDDRMSKLFKRRLFENRVSQFLGKGSDGGN